MNAEPAITRLSADEVLDLDYLACAQDFYYWFEHYSWIRDERSGIVHGPGLVLWPGQRDYLDKLISGRSLIAGKARQLGVSWLAGNVETWELMFRSHIAQAIIAQNDYWAMFHLARNRWIYRQQPGHLRRYQEVRGADNMHELGLTNGSSIVAYPSTSSTLRGGGKRRVRLEELAHWGNARAVLTAAQGSVGDGGQLVINSTGNGEGEPYWQAWQDAIEGRVDYATCFIPWHAHPERDQAWYDGMAARLGPLMRQEYPASPDEMFLAVGSRFFDTAQLRALQAAHTREPLRRYEQGGVEWIIWAEPQPGRQYAVGADVADGGGDACSADVLDCLTGEQVAHLHSFVVQADTFGDQLYQAGELYGWALVAVERNNMGAATLAILQRRQYPNLYYHQHWDLTAATMRPRAGWVTDNASRPVLLNDYRTALQSGQMVLQYERSYTEARAFGFHDGRWDHPAGGHDDTVFSAAIAQQARQRIQQANEADQPIVVYCGEDRTP